MGREYQQHYYSDRLLKKLDLLLQPAAVVEAPSGYGKTTAVRDYLKNSLPGDIPVFWFHAVASEPSDAAWRRLCEIFRQIDAKSAGSLLKLSPSNQAEVGASCELIQRLGCGSDTWLVVDDAQNLTLPAPIFPSLLSHDCGRLHVVLITQLLQREALAFVRRHGTAYLSQRDLCLSEEELRAYFLSAGISVGDQEAARIRRNTGGWIAAASLLLNAATEQGKIPDTYGVLSLLEELVWNGLDDDQQTLLLRISPFQTVTAAQAVFLSRCDCLTEPLRRALQSPLIRFDPAERRYEIHELLLELLREKCRERGLDFERDCLAAAGDWERENDRLADAMGFYVRARDMGRILSLDLSVFYTETIDGTPFYRLALQIFRECPDELMKLHPLSMLRVAYALLTAGKEAAFSALLQKLCPLLCGENAESRWLRADWTLLSSFLAFPDLAAMTGTLRQAAELFAGRPSRVIFPNSPWGYSVITPFALFHAVPGAAEQEYQALAAYVALYSGATGGHGAGMDLLFRVERACYACDFGQAEIAAYQAAFVSQSHGQDLIRLAAVFHLAWIAAQKQDSAGWRSAFAALTSAPDALLRRCFVLPSAIDTVRGILLSEMGMGDGAVPGWLGEGDFSGEQLPGFTLLRAMLHFGTLLHQKEYSRLAGAAEAVYPGGIPMERFGDLFPALAVAAGYEGLGRRETAKALIRRAAAFALPDGLYSQLIVYDQLTGGLVAQCVHEDFPEYEALFCQAQEAVQETLSAVYPSVSAAELPGSLTAREREVALLAADGLTNEQIAHRLSLTVSTVRTHLRSVFRKLDIDRRTKLAEKLL